MLSITDPLGRKTAHTHDAMGNVTTITRLADTPEAVTTEFTYEPKFNQPGERHRPIRPHNAFVYDEKGT